MTKYCYDFKDEPGFPGCCSSCHEDIEEGHGDYCGPDGFLLCCRVDDWLEKRGYEVTAHSAGTNTEVSR
jgi:hypothetical protein